MRFTDKVVIVTGAANGIGLATARRFASEGARVAILDLHADAAEAAAAALPAESGNTGAGFACDVSDEARCAAVVADVMARFGRLDVVVNNAGMMLFKNFADYTAADWLRVLGVDLMGAVHLTTLAFKNMPHGGSVVNVSSVHAQATTPQVAPYAAAKAAILAMTRSASIEGAPLGIRVNAVLPGAVDTPMLWDNPNVKAGIEKIDPSVVGKPEELAAAIAFLAADEARFVTGASLPVDGGRLAKL